jgi:hypothetical protein
MQLTILAASAAVFVGFAYPYSPEYWQGFKAWEFIKGKLAVVMRIGNSAFRNHKTILAVASLLQRIS